MYPRTVLSHLGDQTSEPGGADLVEEEPLQLVWADPSHRWWPMGPGGTESPKSREEACMEWATCMVWIMSTPTHLSHRKGWTEGRMGIPFTPTSLPLLHPSVAKPTRVSPLACLQW